MHRTCLPRCPAQRKTTLFLTTRHDRAARRTFASQLTAGLRKRLQLALAADGLERSLMADEFQRRSSPSCRRGRWRRELDFVCARLVDCHASGGADCLATGNASGLAAPPPLTAAVSCSASGGIAWHRYAAWSVHAARRGIGSASALCHRQTDG